MKKKKISKFSRAFYASISYISPKLNTKLLFLRKFGRMPDLKEPKTLNEKLLKLKLERYGTDPLVRKCADKYRVREFIEDRGCSSCLNKILGVYDKAEDIDFDALPNQFVLKWNFGCGFNLICDDKTKLNIPETVGQLKKWGKEPFWTYYSELQYRGVPKKIIAEEFIGDSEGNPPEDYKFYCFNGNAYCVMLCEGRKEGWPKFYFFDRDFNLLRINRDSKEAPDDFSRSKPAGIEDAFHIADKLSEGFPFVRVDLYITGGQVRFGEMTFTPAAALDNKRLPETDLMFGEMLKEEI